MTARTSSPSDGAGDDGALGSASLNMLNADALAAALLVGGSIVVTTDTPLLQSGAKDVGTEYGLVPRRPSCPRSCAGACNERATSSGTERSFTVTSGHPHML